MCAMVVEVGPEIEQLVFQICRRPVSGELLRGADFAGNRAAKVG